MITEVINKIIITAEAVFDYEESLCLGSLDRRALKAEVEEYINTLNRSGRLLYDRYFRCKYYDEESDRMLMLFLYRADKISVMQNWELKGICIADEWSQDAEDEGLIRVWLETKITDLADEEDWAVRVRTNKIIKFTEKTLYENVLKEVRDEFEIERDKAAAETLLLLQDYHFKRGKRKRFKRKNSCN